MSSFDSGGKSGSLQHWQNVVEEIKRIRALDEAKWIPEIPDLCSETLMHMANLVRHVDQEIFDLLVIELSQRTTRISQKLARGFKKIPTEEIVGQVAFEIVALILSPPSSQSHFLEMTFATAVKRRTLTAVRDYQRSVFGHIGDFTAIPADDDDGEIEPLEFIPDHRPNAEIARIAREDGAERRHLLVVAYSAITKRRHRQAFILHYVVGMPVESKAGNPNLAAYFKVKPAVVWYWLERALAQTREALGVTQ